MVKLNPHLPLFRFAPYIMLGLVLTLSAVQVPAQVIAGSLKVRVVDANGIPVAGASVIITKENRGPRLERITSRDGIAFFNNLEPGSYSIDVVALGFAVTLAKAVPITIVEARSVTVRLETNVPGRIVVASINEEPPEQLSALPNLNNDLTPLLQVVPGAVAIGSAALGKVVIDGKGKDQQNARLDGVDATAMVDVPLGDSALDAVSGFQKPEAAYDVDNSGNKSKAFEPKFGPGTGTLIEGKTYGRIESWQAQLYAAHRNDFFNARNFFDYDGRNAIRRTRAGGKLGGPVQKNSFIYMGYEGVRGRAEQTIYEAVPADASCLCGSGPTAPLLSGFLPAGNSLVAGASLNPDFLVAKRRGRSSVQANVLDIRFDTTHERATSKLLTELPKNSDNFTLRFLRQVATNVVPDGVTARQQRQQIRFTNFLAEWKRLSSKGIIHDFKFGLNETAVRVDAEIPTSTNAALSESLMTISGTVNVTGFPDGRLTLPVATLGRLIKGVGRGFNLTPRSFSISYDFDRPSRKHEIFFGFEARFTQLAFDRLGGLTYTFPNAKSLRDGTPRMITFLSDLSAPSPFSNGQGPRHAKQVSYLSYLQIASQLSPRVKANYGVRYDYFGSVRERDNRAVLVDPQTGVFLPAGTGFYASRKNNFQPRFGIDFSSNPKETDIFKLHAGIGIYSGVPKLGDLLIPIDSDRFSTGINGGAYPTNPADIIKFFTDNPDTRQFQPLVFARNFRIPERAYKWESSVTRTRKGFDFTVLYTGNVGRNLPLAGIANQIIRVDTNPDPTQPAIVIRQFDIVRNGQVFKPFGEFFFRNSDGRSSYNGLTLQLKRNTKSKPNADLPAWLKLADLNVQYTLSRNVGNVSGAVISDPLNLNSDFGYNTSDARHSFKLSGVYNLWEQLGRPRDSLLWGWRIAPSIVASSGLPLIVRLDRPDVVYVDGGGLFFSMPAVGRRAVINVPGGGAAGGTRTPNLIPGIPPYLHSGINLLNPQAFAIPSPGTIGNMRRGQLRGPASFQTDVALTHYLFYKEKTSAELKIEVFNIFNRANFNNPNVSLPSALGTEANQVQPNTPFTSIAAGAFGIISAADPGRQFQFSLTLRLGGSFVKEPGQN